MQDLVVKGLAHCVWPHIVAALIAGMEAAVYALLYVLCVQADVAVCALCALSKLIFALFNAS